MTGTSGLKVFVVEDEGAVALLIEDMLDELGCKVVASVGSLAQAERSAADAEVDLAMLDVNIGGESVLPIAGLFHDRHIPLLFSTGYGEAGLPDQFSGFPVLSKPFSIDQLREKIAAALSRRS